MKSYTGILIFSLLASCSTQGDKLFTKLSPEETGITFNNHIVETEDFNVLTDEYIFNGGGVAVEDFNKDGKMDLFFTGNQVSNRLYLNNGNFKFDDVTEVAGLNSKGNWSTGVATVDINLDGWPDLYVCSAMEGNKKNRLYIHQGLDSEGNPTFKEMAEEFGVDDASNSMHALFFDYNNDGLLDLYVLNDEISEVNPSVYRSKILDGSALGQDHLYKNTGNNQFIDVSEEAGITIEGYGLGIAASDVNGDGWTDLYVSNDYISNDILYINQQDGTFKNEIRSYIKHQSKFSMGNDISDFNNDGLVDLVTVDMLGETNYRKKTTIGKTDYQEYLHNEKYDYEYQHSRNMLHLGNPAGIPYSEVGMMAGVYQTDWSWSPLFIDANNDGWRDLFITNGFPRDITDLDFISFKFEYERYAQKSMLLDSMPSIKIPNYVYKNKGDLQFDDKTVDWGMNFPSFSNGAVYVDLDNDGDLDYVVNNINDPAFVFQNNLYSPNKESSNHYISVTLEGPDKNKTGIGAVVELSSNGNKQFYHQYLSRGYMSSVDPRIFFGLGDHQNIDYLKITWKDGTSQIVENIEANQSIQLKHDQATTTTNTPMAHSASLFADIADEANIRYRHSEKDFEDYNIQRLLPHKISQSGPCMEVGDFNGDGIEDFVIGSSIGSLPTLFTQSQDNRFVQTALYQKDSFDRVEECIKKIDIDKDGDLDLLITAKNESYTKQQNYLAINNGAGVFELQEMDELSEGSIIAVNDFNGDGYEDVFIGGGASLLEFPKSMPSKLLINNNGTFTDSGSSIIGDIESITLVTDAIWADINSDGKDDLIVVGEFNAVRTYLNNGSELHLNSASNIGDKNGIWNSVLAFDADLDGDIDLVAGNIGMNNYMHLSQQYPATIVAKDFDNNGSVEPILFTYEKGKDSIFRPYPYVFKDNLSEQSPLFRKQFKLYKNYGDTDLKKFFTKEDLTTAQILTANYEKSVLFKNDGKGTFEIIPLPELAQIAPISDFETTDYNGDGYPDLLLVGNDHRYDPFVGHLDALNGLLLENLGNGTFKAIPAGKSGINVSEDGQEIHAIQAANGERNFLVTQNRSDLKYYKKQN